MRKELKLAFDELEKELLVIPPDDLFRFMGGFSTGSSSSGSSGLSADASIDEVVDYLKDTGMSFTQDSSGNYYFNPVNSSGTSIRLDEVVVTGFQSTGSSGSWDTGGTGASGFNSTLDMYVAYLSGYGHVFSGSNGNYTYVPSSTSNPGNTQSVDPWKRDAGSGKIVAVTTGSQRFVYNDYGDEVLMEEYKLTSVTGITVTAYKAVGVNENGTLRPATAAEGSNCLGWALTGGEYTFIDNPATNNIDEGMVTRVGFTSWSGYTPCSKEEASLVMIYDSATGGAIHAGTIAADGTYSAKGGGSDFPLRTGMTENEFFKPWEPKYNPITGQMEQIDYRPQDPNNVVYYKKNN